MPYLSPQGRIEVTTAPAAEPISTADAKAWLRIPAAASEDDTLIDALVTAARVWVEEYTQRKLITQTVTQHLDALPGYNSEAEMPSEGRISDYLAGASRWIELIANPVQSITSFTTYTDDDTATVWASSNYRLSSAGDRARLVPVGSASWPTYTRTSDGVVIVYVAGYGNAGSDIPDAILQAMKLMLAHWYENREAVVTGVAAQDVPLTVKALLAPYRYVSI